ncbi:MAG TPA: DUF2089 domain-containing protein [Kineosporiaceae bacterium]|nr:DUF2089 domain-containing protein [Kineosporiaceae bacterium]
MSTGPSAFASPLPPARHRPPRDCPVCAGHLEVTQLGCPSCGTGLTGRFRPCEFCGLDDADREVLTVFLASRGNMKDLERHLGVSYPTARARFDDLLRRLGLANGSGTRERATDARERGTETRERSVEKLDTLRALAKGELDVDEARQRLGGTD